MPDRAGRWTPPAIFARHRIFRSPALGNAFSAAGDFQLPPATEDAALLVTLPPGNYSAQVSGVGGTAGVALVEIYEVR